MFSGRFFSSYTVKENEMSGGDIIGMMAIVAVVVAVLLGLVFSVWGWIGVGIAAAIVVVAGIIALIIGG
jgi:hypothetical protein